MAPMKKIKAGIIGGAGYTGGELIRLLIHHPAVEIIFVQSKSKNGKKIASVHRDLLGDTEMVFSAATEQHADVVFLCTAHGEAKKIINEYAFPAGTRFIDLSQDHRIADPAFVYGLPELNRESICTAKHIANPGCFATAIQLALLPLAKNGILNSPIHINATTGSTGAGQSLSETAHFSWRQNNISVYKAFTHQHVTEIKQSLKQFNGGNPELVFIPQRGAFTRGILASIVVPCREKTETLQHLYRQYYETHPFVILSNSNIDLKQVVNTNKCILYLEQQGNHLCIVSVLDNLLKGASGQAVQNMNLLMGIPETTGLLLKASAF
jgi:N-acetyl-gamma-glutamyl-phosphate reductase